MSVQDKIKEDVKESMRSGDSQRTLTLRMLLSSLHNREIEEHARGIDKIDDRIVIDVLRKEAKKRREAAEIYAKAGRKDLENKELEELKIIQDYLPAEMTEAKIEKIVNGVIAKGTKDFGAVMKESVREIAGRAEAGRVSTIVKRLLQ